MEISFEDMHDLPPAKSKPTVDVVNISPEAQISLGAGVSKATIARFNCPACINGTYMRHGVVYGDCFKCKGTGKVKTDPQVTRARKQAKITKQLDARQAWVAAHRTEYDFAVAATWSEFARKLISALDQGPWSDGQLQAVRSMMDKQAARNAAPRNIAGTIDMTRMLKAFDSAVAARLKYPKLHIGDLVFSLASATSKNAGQIYAKLGGEYLGRIDRTGNFFPVSSASDAQRAEVLRIGADPLTAAILHGKQTGSCACCGRELENEESVAAGIGPICRQKWGF